MATVIVDRVTFGQSAIRYILAVGSDPASDGLAAGLGSKAELEDGSAEWRKTGALDTDWVRVDVLEHEASASAHTPANVGATSASKMVVGAQPGGILDLAGVTSVDITAEAAWNFSNVPGVEGHGEVAGIPVLLEVTSDGTRGAYNTVAGRVTLETLEDEGTYDGVVLSYATLSLVQGVTDPDKPRVIFTIITTPARDTTGPYTLRFFEGNFDSEGDPYTPIALTGWHFFFTLVLAELSEISRDFVIGPFFGIERLAKPLAVASGNAGLLSGTDKAKLDALEESRASITMSGNSTDFALTTLNQWYQVATFDSDAYSAGSFVADQANDRITIGSGFNGVVEVDIHASAGVNATNQDIEIGWSQDGGSTIVTPVLSRRYANASDIGNSSMVSAAPVDASGGDIQITIWARNTTIGGNKLTVQEMSVSARNV